MTEQTNKLAMQRKCVSMLYCIVGQLHYPRTVKGDVVTIEYSRSGVAVLSCTMIGVPGEVLKSAVTHAVLHVEQGEWLLTADRKDNARTTMA